MNKIYFISDCHFNHDKEFIWKERGYNSIKEMNKDIVKKWNNIIDDNDIIYHLGDLALGNVDEAIKYIKQLKGQIHLIRGNHCTDNKVERYKELDNIIDIKYADMIKYKKWSFYLSHYPTMMGCWADQKKLWNISGHTHSKDKFENKEHKVYNVAADAHDCEPVEIEQIIKDIKEIE